MGLVGWYAGILYVFFFYHVGDMYVWFDYGMVGILNCGRFWVKQSNAEMKEASTGHILVQQCRDKGGVYRSHSGTAANKHYILHSYVPGIQQQWAPAVQKRQFGVQARCLYFFPDLGIYIQLCGI